MDSRVFGLRVFRLIIAVCLALALGDFFYEKHGHYAAEEFFAAYGIYGFVACVSLVLAAVQLRKLVMRDEDYYDR